MTQELCDINRKNIIFYFIQDVKTCAPLCFKNKVIMLILLYRVFFFYKFKSY